MKNLIEKIVRRRNPEFRFDEHLDNKMLFHLFTQKTFQWLRAKRLLLKFRRSQHMLLGKSVQFHNVHKIKWGKWVKIENNVFLSGLGTGQLTIGDHCGIGAYSRIEISTSYNNLGSHIHIGNSVGLGPYACLGGAGGLEIGDECIIGPYLSCHPENHNFDQAGVPIRRQGVNRKGIKIGKNCWIGAKVTILDGVEIGDGCVIAAGAVVNKSMPANSIIGGVPAKVIRATHSDSAQPLKKVV